MILFILYLLATVGLYVYMKCFQEDVLRNCKVKLIISYILTLIPAIFIGLKEPDIAEKLIRVVMLLMLAVMSVIDYEKKIIPNGLVLIGLLCGLVYYIGLFVLKGRDSFPIIGGRLFAGFGFLAVFLIIALLSKGIGGGDIKIIGLLAAVCGYTIVMGTLMWALILSFCVAIGLLLLRKKNKKDEIPFGPFLFMGYSIMLLANYLFA